MNKSATVGFFLGYQQRFSSLNSDSSLVGDGWLQCQKALASVGFGGTCFGIGWLLQVTIKTRRVVCGWCLEFRTEMK